jgi:hypothetical protein
MYRGKAVQQYWLAIIHPLLRHRHDSMQMVRCESKRSLEMLGVRAWNLVGVREVLEKV